MFTVWQKEMYRGRQYWESQESVDHFALTRYQTTLPHVMRQLPPSGLILDAGCGLGRWTSHLSRMGYRVLGSDRDERALRIAKRKGCSIVRCDVRELPFASGSFDAVLSFGVVEHFRAGPRDALREARRILKPGGLLFLSVPYVNPLRKIVFHPLLNSVIFLRKCRGHKYCFFEYRYALGEIRSALKKEGYEIDGIYPDDFAYPRSMGLYLDWFFLLGKKGRPWELNAFGKLLYRIVNAVSPWLHCAGAMFTAQKTERKPSAVVTE